MRTTTRLDKTSLAEQAYNQIRNLILDQVIRPGDFIGIDSIAATLGVSQTPIRESLARLEGDRLVVRLRSGRYQAAPAMSWQDFAHLYQIRLLLEPAAAALAAEHRSEQTVISLEHLVEEITAAGRGSRSQDFIAFVDADSQFHQLIAEDCGNKYIAGALAQLQVNLRVGPFYRGRGVVDAEAVISEHAKICQAIRAKDPQAAEAAMRQHVERARDVILAGLKGRTDLPPDNHAT
jgi:DNA-binding GntR family transcriptional regulator